MGLFSIYKIIFSKDTWFIFMNDLDFFVTCVGIFKMAKPSRMNRHFEICEKMILRWSSFKSMVHFYKTLQFSLEIGGLCLGVWDGETMFGCMRWGDCV